MARNNLKPMKEVMDDLRAKGYQYDFRMKDKEFIISSTGKHFSPEDIIIEDEYRFEGNSNPGDMSILYAIKTSSGEKGIAVNGYGVSADPDLDDFLMRASEKDRK